jgi:hypothetical protein
MNDEAGMETNGITVEFGVSMTTSFGGGLREGLADDDFPPPLLRVIEGEGRGSKRKRPKLRVIEGGGR